MHKTTLICRQKIATFLTKNMVGGAKKERIAEYAKHLEKQHRTETATPRISVPANMSLCGCNVVAYFGQPEDFS